MNIKNEKIILVGPSGSGKDFLLRGLVTKGLKYFPKFTTRPKRSLETNGVEYDFISESQFHGLLESGDIKTHQVFPIKDEKWYYGISKENFDDNQAFIMTPHELSMLSTQDRKQSFVVYLDIDESVRRQRLSNRNDNNDSVERRISADNQDFKNFNNYDLRLNDPTFEIDWIYDLMF